MAVGHRIPRGEHQQAIDEAPGPAQALSAVARLLHAQGFDPVPLAALGVPALEYEVRWSESCEACGSIWLCTKAGELLRIDLHASSFHSEKRLLGRGARTLLHAHGELIFEIGDALLVGTDDGYLHVLRRATEHSEQRSPRIHIDSWWRELGGRAIRTTTSIPRAGEARYTIGITAMALLPRDAAGSRILMATRSGALFLLRAFDDQMELFQIGPRSGEPAMVGWIQWILRIPGDSYVTCVSRGGEISRVPIERPEDGFEVTSLSLLPTAAMPWSRGMLLGSTEGLVYWEPDRKPRTLSVPITRAAVLCLDRLQIPRRAAATEQARPRGFVIMGLDNGRLRVVNERVLTQLANGDTVNPDARSYSTDLGSAILAVEVLKPHADDVSRCFLLAALRDHSLRLFHVETRERTVERTLARWSELAASIGSADDLATWKALLASARTRGDRDAITYLFIDVILPTLRARPPETRPDVHSQLIAMIPGASPQVLDRISRDIAVLAGDGADTLIEVSVALLKAMPRDDRRAWSKFVEQHLKSLHDAARACPTADEHARLIAWARFVRKYILMGATFAEKVSSLRRLVEVNAGTHKYLDALIYQAQLYHRRYDLAWRATVDGDLHSLHATRSLVIAVTSNGALTFFSHDGRRLHVEGDGEAQQILAVAVVSDGGDRLLVAVSRAGAASAPTLSMLEIEHAPQRFHVTSHPVRQRGGAQPVAVHALCPLPDHHDRVLAGLDDPEHLFGIIGLETRIKNGRTESHWWFDLLARPPHAPARQSLEPLFGAVAPTPEISMLAPGKVPSRAISAACLDAPDRGDHQGESYLAAVGSDDGTVRLVWFTVGAGGRDVSVTATRSHGLLYPINAVALDRVRTASGSLLDTHTCYIGTSSGELFAGDIPRTPGVEGAQPSWRETYDRPLIAVQPWRTPLYPDARVLLTAPEKGRLCLYETRLWRGADTPSISETNNYFFRGARLDRISLPSAISCFAAIDGACEFVAGGPRGQILMGTIVYARDSDARVDDNHRVEGGLPVNMWERFAALREHLDYGSFFFPDLDEPEQRRREQEICDLIYLEGGALRRYLLRELLTKREPWRVDGAEIKRRAEALLAGLRPGLPEDRERLKIVLKSLARAVLDRNPRQIIDEVKKRRTARALHKSLKHEREAVRAAVRVLARQIHDASLLPARDAGRIRIIAFKELFRLHVLRHAMNEGGTERPILGALTDALRACLRDDDRLVRIEALRAVGLALRNIGVLRDRLDHQSPSLGESFAKHVFPYGVEQLFWLVDLLTESLRRYPNFTPTAVLSTAWYYVSALTPIFRLFPESTLVLCNRITRAGVATSALEVIVQRLRGSATEDSVALIRKLYLLPHGAAARDTFITDYKKRTVEQWFKDRLPRFAFKTEGDAHGSEERVARRLITLYDFFASCWEITDPDRLKKLKKPAMDPSLHVEATGPIDGLDEKLRGPIGTAEMMAGELADLAHQLRPRRAAAPADEEKRATIAEYRQRLDGIEAGRLTSPVRRIVRGILDHWLSMISDHPAPDVGDFIGDYRLGVWLGEGGYGRVYRAARQQGERSPTELVAIKVFRLRHDPDGSARIGFRAGIQKNLALSSIENLRGVVRLIKEIPDARYPACVMEYCDRADLRRFLDEQPNLKAETRVQYALWLAQDVGAGLSLAHGSGIVHGDIHARNILVHRISHGHFQFKLCDFDLAYYSSEDSPSTGRRRQQTPPSLARSDLRGPESGKWHDALAFAMVLYGVLTGDAIRSSAGEEELAAARASLAKVDCGKDDWLRAVLLRILGEGEPFTDGSSFLESMRRSGPALSKRALLSVRDRDEIHEAILQARIQLDALRTSLDPALVARLRTGDNPAAQVLMDLNALNSELSVSPDPLEVLLNNAIRLAPQHKRLFESKLKLRRGEGH